MTLRQMRRGVIRITTSFFELNFRGKHMRRSALGLSLVTCLLVASCKGDNDPGDDEPRTSRGRDGGEPVAASGDGGASSAGTLNGKAFSCRCDDQGCVVEYDGRKIQSGGKVVLSGVTVASEGRCFEAP